MLAEILFAAVGIIILNKWILKNIRNSQDNIEKVVYSITIIISNIFLIIYYVDRLNLPSFLKITTNIDSQNWLTIVTSCISSIISAAIGGLIAFGIARNEIKENNKQNRENNRIQNLPLLKYKITTNNIIGESDSKKLIVFNNSNKNTSKYNLQIFIKNIGLNNVKKVIIDFCLEGIDKKYNLLGEDTQVPIEKDESINIYRFFRLRSNKKYKMHLNVYYEDVLQNWYLQVVDIDYVTTNIHNGSTTLSTISYKIAEEKIINLKDIK